jgi:excisionase family DNA binding protein
MGADAHGGGPFQRQRASLGQMTTSAGRELTRTNILSTSEVAELLGIPRSTVHELARRGDLPARRVGRRWIFLRDRLAAAITPLDDPAAWRPENDA